MSNRYLQTNELFNNHNNHGRQHAVGTLDLVLRSSRHGSNNQLVMQITTISQRRWQWTTGTNNYRRRDGHALERFQFNKV